ncbi:MAG: tryptophan synthase subunit alpha [Alphaproteobacteria bacterium]
MSRIASVFAALDRPALKIFLTAGDPSYDRSLTLLRQAAISGADMIELGMPFSDPAADGPTVEAGGYRALKNGASMKNTFRLLQDFRETDNNTPVILMGYANPLIAYGPDFVRDAAAAGADGLLVVDIPPEESEDLQVELAAHKMDLIRLMTPTTDEKRLETILKGASGFLYYISIVGVTGTVRPEPALLKPHLDRIRKQTNLPIAVGFGISTPEDVRSMSTICDAVVVGSAVVKIIAAHENSPDLARLVGEQIKALAQGLRK